MKKLQKLLYEETSMNESYVKLLFPDKKLLVEDIEKIVNKGYKKAVKGTLKFTGRPVYKGDGKILQTFDMEGSPGGSVVMQLQAFEDMVRIEAYVNVGGRA